jgi:hypothetical protein
VIAQQVLRVGLDTAADVRVRLELLTDVGEGWGTAWSADVPAEDLGVPTSMKGEPVDDARFRLPEAVTSGLAGHVSRAVRVTWLQLAEPFGYLGMVPWEALLDPVVRGPVVRLATIDVAARVPSADLQVALLAVPPDPHRRTAAHEYLHGVGLEAASRLPRWARGRAAATRRGSAGPLPAGEDRLTAQGVELLVEAILDGSPRRTTVHVVTTPWLCDELHVRWQGRTWPVHLHHPWPSAAGSPIRAGRGRADRAVPVTQTATDWFSQVTAAMGGEQADVVHLVCGASISGARVRLVTADVPDDSGPGGSRFVSLSNLRQFLDAVGAWSVHLTAAPGDRAVPALRLAASRLVEERPGPVVLTDLATDRDAADVRAAYRFLARAEATVPPCLPHALLGCEPQRVRGGEAVVGGPHTSVTAAARAAGSIDAIIHAEETPAWVAAAQRFIEHRQLELARLRRDAPVGSATPEGRQNAEGIEEAIAALMEVVDTWAAENRRSP